MERKYISCKMCDHFHWSDQKCPPIFHVEYDNEEDKEIIYAYDHQSAAEKFAENYNERNEYYLMDNEMQIKVTDSEGESKNFIIGAEQSINYWSKEV